LEFPPGSTPQGQSEQQALEASPTQPYPLPNWLTMSPAMDLPGMVDPEAVGKLTDKGIVDWVQQCVQTCKDARRGLEEEWRNYTDLYLNRRPLDAGAKADWQADIFVPLIFNKVELAKSLVKGALLDAPGSWFMLEEYPTYEYVSAQVRFIEKVMRYQLERGQFVDEYMKALEEGFLLGSGCLKLYWDDWIDRGPQLVDMPTGQVDPMTGMPMTFPIVRSAPRPRNGLKIRQVPVLSMYPDPFARTFNDAKWVVEEVAVDEEELRDGQMAGIYDSIDDIGAPVAFDLETDYRMRETGLTFKAPGPSRKRHLLQIYHGNLYTKDGRLALQNWKVVVANKRTVIACSPNPLYTGRKPYIWSTPIPVRGRLWGRSMVAAAATMQVELNNLANEILDSTTLSVLPIVRVDNAKLDEPFEFESVHPGMLIRGRDGAAEQVRIQSVPNDAWPVIQWLQQGVDDATGMRDLMAGKPTAKGRPTAFEIKQAMAGGQENVENLARTLESRDLEPAVQLAYELTMQFLSDTSDPELQAIMAQEGAPPNLADPVLRYRVLSAPFKVKARGISMILSRDEQISKRMQLAQMGMQMGVPAPNGPLQLYYGIARLMGIDPKDIGQPETPEEMQMLMMQMQAQAQGQGGDQGGDPGQTRDVPPEPPQAPPGPPQPNSPQEITNQVNGMGPPMPGM
jgi:hypothetical protein